MTAAALASGVSTIPIGELLVAMEHLPAQGNVALRVLWMADNPETTISDLERAVQDDPVLVARLLHLANSAYYSPLYPITAVKQAILLLGFATVRTMATVVACGLTRSVPARFWTHAAATATAAQLVAGRFGVEAGEAFAVGLLHDLGRGLFHVADPAASTAFDRRLQRDRHAAATTAGQASDQQVVDRLTLERARFGMTHAEAAARVLEAWRLPPQMVQAIGAHHDPIDAMATDTVRLVVAAEALAELALGCCDEPLDCEAGIALLDLDLDRVDTIVDRIRTEAIDLSAVLSA